MSVARSLQPSGKGAAKADAPEDSQAGAKPPPPPPPPPPESPAPPAPPIPAGPASTAGFPGVAAHLKPYKEAVQRFGACFEATLWASEKHQRTRFEVLVDECPFAGVSVLDAGCARAELMAYLGERGISPRLYAGIEGVHELANAARERLKHCAIPSVVVEGDFVADAGLLARVAKAAGAAGDAEGRADVVVFSGSLNTLKTEAAIRVLDRAWPVARRALVFNFLSDCCTDEIRGGDTGPAHRFDTVRVLAWALTRTTRVRFRQDYFPGGHDATVVMLRESE